MQITFTEEIFINGLRFQLHQAIAGVVDNQREIVSILTEAKKYSENRLPVREINRKHFSQVTFLARNSRDYLLRVHDGLMPSVDDLNELIQLLEKF